MDQVGKALAILGLGLAALGGLIWFLHGASGGRLGQLPGDLAIRRDGFSVFVPITSMLILSAVLTGVLWLIGALRR